MAFKIKYNKHRHPIQQKRADGVLGCRGCGGKVPKGRKTWCSRLCYTTYDPKMVLMAVKRRDKGICTACGFNCAQAKREWRNLYGRRKMLKPPIAEYDHIIPFSEGGLTVAENLRTLCNPCHKARTRVWVQEKAQKLRRLYSPAFT